MKEPRVARTLCGLGRTRRRAWLPSLAQSEVRRLRLPRWLVSVGGEGRLPGRPGVRKHILVHRTAPHPSVACSLRWHRIRVRMNRLTQDRDDRPKYYGAAQDQVAPRSGWQDESAVVRHADHHSVALGPLRASPPVARFQHGCVVFHSRRCELRVLRARGSVPRMSLLVPCIRQSKRQPASGAEGCAKSCGMEEPAQQAAQATRSGTGSTQQPRLGRSAGSAAAARQSGQRVNSGWRPSAVAKRRVAARHSGQAQQPGAVTGAARRGARPGQERHTAGPGAEQQRGRPHRRAQQGNRLAQAARWRRRLAAAGRRIGLPAWIGLPAGALRTSAHPVRTRDDERQGR